MSAKKFTELIGHNYAMFLWEFWVFFSKNLGLICIFSYNSLIFKGYRWLVILYILWAKYCIIGLLALLGYFYYILINYLSPSVKREKNSTIRFSTANRLVCHTLVFWPYLSRPNSDLGDSKTLWKLRDRATTLMFYVLTNSSFR